MHTVVLIKPDAVSLGKIGEILTRLESFFTIRCIRMVQIEEWQLREHYKDHKDKPFFKDLIDFMMSGLIVQILVEGHILAVRDSMMAYRKENGAITHGPRNLVHSSDSLQAASRELQLWFPTYDV